MSKKIDWLDNFAESMAKKTNMSKVASKIEKEDIIVDREEVRNAKVGETINFNGKLYKVADLNFEDEKGPGAVLTEVEETPFGEVSTNDPMSVSMGAPAEKFETGQKPQEYARTNPGDVYHYEVPETFEQAAVETAQQIETERNFDRTSVPGHYTAPKNMGGAAPVMETPAVEEPVAPVTPVETPVDAPVEEVVEDTVEETPVDEVLEAPVDETPSEEVVEAPEAVVETEEVVEDPETSENDSDDEDEDKSEDKEEDKEPVVGTRYNRILRRIMASK